MTPEQERKQLQQRLEELEQRRKQEEQQQKEKQAAYDALVRQQQALRQSLEHWNTQCEKAADGRQRLRNLLSDTERACDRLSGRITEDARRAEQLNLSTTPRTKLQHISSSYQRSKEQSRLQTQRLTDLRQDNLRFGKYDAVRSLVQSVLMDRQLSLLPPVILKQRVEEAVAAAPDFWLTDVLQSFYAQWDGKEEDAAVWRENAFLRSPVETSIFYLVLFADQGDYDAAQEWLERWWSTVCKEGLRNRDYETIQLLLLLRVRLDSAEGADWLCRRLDWMLDGIKTRYWAANEQQLRLIGQLLESYRSSCRDSDPALEAESRRLLACLEPETYDRLCKSILLAQNNHAVRHRLLAMVQLQTTQQEEDQLWRFFHRRLSTLHEDERRAERHQAELKQAVWASEAVPLPSLQEDAPLELAEQVMHTLFDRVQQTERGSALLRQSFRLLLPELRTALSLYRQDYQRRMPSPQCQITSGLLAGCQVDLSCPELEEEALQRHTEAFAPENRPVSNWERYGGTVGAGVSVVGGVSLLCLQFQSMTLAQHLGLLMLGVGVVLGGIAARFGAKQLRRRSERQWDAQRSTQEQLLRQEKERLHQHYQSCMTLYERYDSEQDALMQQLGKIEAPSSGVQIEEACAT